MNGRSVLVRADRIETHIEQIPLAIGPEAAGHPVSPGGEEGDSAQMPVPFEAGDIVQREVEDILAARQHFERTIADGWGDVDFEAASGICQTYDRNAVIFHFTGGAGTVSYTHLTLPTI